MKLTTGWVDFFSSVGGLLGGNSQNFLSKFVRFFVTFGLEILRILMLKVIFEADNTKR